MTRDSPPPCHGAQTRTVFVGGPRTGKSTAARERRRAGVPTYCGDPESKAKEPEQGVTYLPEGLPFAGDSGGAAYVAGLWLSLPGPWVCEGQVMARALRRWLAAHPDGDERPCDEVVVFAEPKTCQTPGQAAMSKGVATVWAEVRDELERRGVVIR